jgi:hypothetical protein
MKIFNFPIKSLGQISNLFLENNCTDFLQAQEFIRHLPYRRNSNKNNLVTVFDDEHGTCSTKHAVLKQLALEHNKKQVIPSIFIK